MERAALLTLLLVASAAMAAMAAITACSSGKPAASSANAGKPADAADAASAADTADVASTAKPIDAADVNRPGEVPKPVDPAPRPCDHKVVAMSDPAQKQIQCANGESFVVRQAADGKWYPEMRVRAGAVPGYATPADAAQARCCPEAVR
jgi:hypothetical protein